MTRQALTLPLVLLVAAVSAPGIALAAKAGHGFTSNGGDSTMSMFDFASLAVIRKIGIPIGTLTVLHPKTGDIVGQVKLENNAPEGAAADGKGRIFVNNEGKSTMQVIEVKSMKAVASWPTAPCEGPTGIAYDAKTNRVIAGCGRTSIVVDAASGRVVATVAGGGTRRDAAGAAGAAEAREAREAQ